jgi:lipoic acid synthetase
LCAMSDRQRVTGTRGAAKPAWLKVRAPAGAEYARIKRTLRKLRLHTVCEQARCPNVAECWGSGTATVLLLGPTCTRSCRFCAVAGGDPHGQLDPGEPTQVAAAVAALGLKYVVLTMVTRDDLMDGGAAHVARTVRELRQQPGGLLVETLISDFGNQASALSVVLDAAPDVFAHNVEVTRRLTPLVRDRRCSYDGSLEVLRQARADGRCRFVKSSLMVGAGETDDEVAETLAELQGAGVQIVTLGQYLRPTERHLPVARYVAPEKFSAYARIARSLGFAFVASDPLVRSSYHAAEAFVWAQRVADIG